MPAKHRLFPGIHRSSPKIADGTRRIYYYAWKGGPRLPGKFASDEFIAAYTGAHAERSISLKAAAAAAEVRPKDIAWVISKYKKSRGTDKKKRGFLDLPPESQKEYSRYLDQIEAEFGDMPLSVALTPEARTAFLEFRDDIAETRSRAAQFFAQVLTRIFSWGYKRGHLTATLVPLGTVYKGTRRGNIWSNAQLDFFLKHAPERIGRAVALGASLGQRMSDILALDWKQFNDDIWTIRTSKTGTIVFVVPVQYAEEVIERTPSVARAGAVCRNLSGRRWTRTGFQTEFGKARKDVLDRAEDELKSAIATGDPASIERARHLVELRQLRFSDLRGTAVTQLWKAGCSRPEIASMTGHTEETIEHLLATHYLSTDATLARKVAERRREEAERLLRRAAPSA